MFTSFDFCALTTTTTFSQGNMSVKHKFQSGYSEILQYLKRSVMAGESGLLNLVCRL